MRHKKIVLTTAGSKKEAQQIARALVERRLAACVNLTGPIESVYRWQENIESAEEWLLFIKTTADAVDNVYEVIRELHSYELPECVAIPLDSGSSQYLQWIEDNVAGSE